MARHILVTGIGYKTGDRVVQNIKAHSADINITGIYTISTVSNKYCDTLYKVPANDDEQYITAILSICEKKPIELIIPASAHEAYLLSLYRRKLPTVATSPAGTPKIFADKYLTYQTLHEYRIPFAKSLLPTDYNEDFEEYIVKTRLNNYNGEQLINPEKPKSFSNQYIIQPFLKGISIITAFYVDKHARMLGFITMEHEQEIADTPTYHLTHLYDAATEAYISKLREKISIKGPCYIHAVVTEDGIIPYEIDCTVADTNIIHAQFGFNDVCYTIDEYLYGKEPETFAMNNNTSVNIKQAG